MSDAHQSALDALGPWIARHERPAWTPQTTTDDADRPVSKFGGRPLLQTEETWPACRVCGLPFELLLQLDLAKASRVSGRDLGPGVLQLFYCVRETSCEPGWEPFNDQCSLCRVIPASGTAVADAAENSFPPRAIVGWTEVVDRPDPEEHDALGLVYDYHFRETPHRPMEVTCPELGLRFEGAPIVNHLQAEISSRDGDKLSGWPRWVQGVEYPSCPECGRRMELLMQLDSEDNVPYMFGDCGIGHITQCWDHKHVVAFGWACG